MCSVVRRVAPKGAVGLVGRAGAPRAGSGAVSKWVICACDSLVDFGAV